MQKSRRFASKKKILPKAIEWYTSEGWKSFNELLCELEQEPINTVWVENFSTIGNVLRKIPKKNLISLFNDDSDNWQLNLDKDGTLYASRVN